VRLSPLGTPASVWPIVPASDDDDDDDDGCGAVGRMRLAGEAEVFGENLPQCHFPHHKSRMTWLGSNPGRRCRKLATNSLSYGTAVSLLTLCLSCKSSGVSFGDGSGKFCGPPEPIHRSGNCSLGQCVACILKCEVPRHAGSEYIIVFSEEHHLRELVDHFASK
jgi:hypothetical protein